jgi:hypothetical protein
LKARCFSVDLNFNLDKSDDDDGEVIKSSRAPGCPVFKVMDEKLPRALADG